MANDGRSHNPLVVLRQCHKCGAIDSGLDPTVAISYDVTADSCEKCGWRKKSAIETLVVSGNMLEIDMTMPEED